MRTIKYYDKNDNLKSIEFVKVFNRWVDESGGVSQFLKTVDYRTPFGQISIVSGFIDYFTIMYSASLPDKGDDDYQEYLHDPYFFCALIKELETAHNTRPLGSYNIITLIIIGLAIVGLISMCS